MKLVKNNKKNRKHPLRKWWFTLSNPLKKFRDWQKEPHIVAPISEEEHECATCNTRFKGNFCPRCGQSSRIGRYSFKIALINFIDVWGLGNRSMLRTIRDLIFRPGYMIRDYLKGMQMAYYPPFNMFFILAAVSIFVTHGINIKGKNYGEDTQTQETRTLEISHDDNNSDTAKYALESSPTDANKDQSADLTKHISHNITDTIFDLQERFPNIFALLALVLVSGLMYIFFRHCPNIPDLRYSEFFIAILYIVNMYSIYSIVFDFFCLRHLSLIALLLSIIPIKQLSGYGWFRTIAKVLLSSIIMFIMFILFILAIVFLIHGYTKIIGA